MRTVKTGIFLYLPYVRFANWEMTQASTGFNPFELLFGRRSRDLLNIVKETWEVTALLLSQRVCVGHAKMEQKSGSHHLSAHA